MLPKKIFTFITLIGLIFYLIGCSDENSSNSFNQSENGEKLVIGSQAQDEFWPKSKTLIASDEDRIQSLLANMSIEDKVGQLVMGEIRHLTPEEVNKYKLGGVLNGGGAFPNNNKHASAAEWLDLADAFYQASIDRKDDAPKIPILWGTDAVHGNSNVFGATMFPHNIGLGATRNPALMKQLGAVTAAEVSATGLYWTFAPTVAVPRDDRWGRTYEGFSEDPAIVAELSAAMIEGLQGSLNKDYLDHKHILATAKHFIGDGGTQNGIDQGNTLVDEQTLSSVHGAGYFSAMDMGIQTVMASFNSWQGNKIHGDHYLLTEVLKNKMGFDGFVVGDWNGHGQVPGCSNGSCAKAINAGVDMIMVPEDWEDVYQNTLKQVKSGEISSARLNDAVSRILRVKLRMGMLDDTGPKSRAGAGDQSLLGHPEHRKIARQAVRESLVLLKNNAQTLPLSPNANVLVAGAAAKEIYNQTGGWSMTWLGSETTLDDFPGATRIVDAIEQSVTQAGGDFEFNEKGEYQNKPDVAIIILSEPPYAEGPGDRPHLAFSPDNREHLAVMKKLQADGVPVVTVFLSGRPMWVNAELNASDAFVAAWLPGTEGQGVSDVLFCSTDNHSDCDFKGKLAFSWPKLPDQGPLNINDAKYEPLFEFGYGLKYGDSIELGEFSEESDLAQASAIGTVLLKGRAFPPFKLVIKEQDKAPILANSSLAKSGNTGVQTQVFDWKLQEDAQRIHFSGSGLHSWKLQADNMISWQTESDQGALLAMEIRVPTRSAKPIFAVIENPAGWKGSLNISEQLSAESFTQWQRFAIPLACFEKRGADLGRISTPLTLQSDGDWTIEVSNIRIVANADGMQQYNCD
ncbi:MAG: glycoside hydrolase family 3 protein [Gammaproteobacteria bacterium]|nr:exo 1,3/1,4-beta-D-glucan glucohydrolase [Gammaproteobacteria bacterium]NNC97594.1 glycoside hydrolase family 3 protein [Gammaproteobacteria bacterium]NNM14789.1 glycoside hydrolase family 3 protein [Gammaproteobacteria bacterium]